MTEDEAKTKTCCGPIPVLIGLIIASRPNDDDPPMANCVGSKCMAWRLGPERTEPGTISEIAGAMREHGLGPLDATAATNRKVRDGYCGLAGEPK